MALLAVFSLGTLIAGLSVLWLGGIREDISRAMSCSVRFDAVGVGLLGMALGGVIAALAQVVPGRECLARRAFCTLLISSFVAVGLGSLTYLFFEAPSQSTPVVGCLHCLATSLALAVAPLVVLVILVRRCNLRHSPMVALCSATGGVAFGAFIVHVSCGMDSFPHVLIGHALAPFIGALLFAPALVFVLRRRADRA